MLSSIFIQFLNGLASASTLFLIAVGLSLIFGVTRIVNFAHGSLYMLGLYVAYTLIEKLGVTPLGFWGGIVGAALAVAAMKKAGSLDNEKLVVAMKGLPVDTPFGKILYRPIDNQSTMGAYVGKIGLKDGKGVMTSWTYSDGAKFLPSDAEVKKLRPAD